MKNYIAFYTDTTGRESARTLEANDLTEACQEAEAFEDDETTVYDVREREGWLEYRLYSAKRDIEDLEFEAEKTAKLLRDARTEVFRFASEAYSRGYGISQDELRSLADLAGEKV